MDVTGQGVFCMDGTSEGWGRRGSAFSIYQLFTLWFGDGGYYRDIQYIQQHSRLKMMSRERYSGSYRSVGFPCHTQMPTRWTDAGMGHQPCSDVPRLSSPNRRSGKLTHNIHSRRKDALYTQYNINIVITVVSSASIKKFPSIRVVLSSEGHIIFILAHL